MHRTQPRWGYRVLLVAAAAIGALALALILTSRSTSSAQASFVGSAKCASCHEKEYATWKESHHAAAMQPAQEGTVAGRFDGSTFTYAGVTSKFFRRDGRYFVNTEGADGNLHDFEIRYTFGISPLQQYLVELDRGRLQPLPIAWDSRSSTAGGQHWFHLSPGPRVTHTDEFHWTGRQQNWNFMCADCHSTGVRKAYDPASDQFRTRWSDISVGCEACHGAASRHVKWAGYPKPMRRFVWRDNEISLRLTERRGVSWAVDTGGLTARRSRPRTTEREISTCAPCHSRRIQISDGYVAGSSLLDYYVPSLLVPGLYYADGQQREEVYTYASFLESRMNHAGVTCSDCHDPHTEKLRAPGNAVCAQCHLPAKYDTASHTFHRAGSAGARCIACHMPTTDYMQIQGRVDHSIRVPRPDQSATLGVPNACNRCHTDRDAKWAAAKVSGWSSRPPAGFQTFARAFANDERGADSATQMLSVVARDSTQPVIVRASALARLASHPGRLALEDAESGVRDPSPLVRRSALQILDAFAPETRLEVVAPLLSDSARAVRIEAVRLLASQFRSLSAGSTREAFSRASEEFVASERYNADRPENRTTLGIFFAQLGRLDDAEAEYRGALKIAPRFAPAYVNLADLMRAKGNEVEGERVLRAGLALVPDDAPLHHALGLLLARSGQVGAAVSELGRAAALAPADARLAYAYAVALNSSGRKQEAIQVLQHARHRNPNDRDLLFGLATFYRDSGNRPEALKWARLLAAGYPDDPDAGSLLESLER